MENNEDRLWAEEHIGYLSSPSGWTPDPVAALTRFHARIAAAQAMRTPWWKWPAWGAAAAVTLILLWPEGRVVAQQLWQMLTVPKLAFVRVNPWPEGTPGPEIKVIGLPIPPQRARDVDEVRWRVHYDPRLPRTGVLSGSPNLLTTFSVAAGTAIKTHDLERALRKAGVTDQAVPRQWDGAHLALHTSSLVIAEWPDVVLVQGLPLTLTAPPDFDFAAFSALILRIGGVGADDAQKLAQNAGTLPPWLVPISRDLMAKASIEEITLNSGSATLVQEEGAWGMGGRITIAWTVPDRVYLLSGHVNRDLAIAVANAVQ